MMVYKCLHTKRFCKLDWSYKLQKSADSVQLSKFKDAGPTYIRHPDSCRQRSVAANPRSTLKYADSQYQWNPSLRIYQALQTTRFPRSLK